MALNLLSLLSIFIILLLLFDNIPSTIFNSISFGLFFKYFFHISTVLIDEGSSSSCKSFTLLCHFHFEILLKL